MYSRTDIAEPYCRAGRARPGRYMWAGTVGSIQQDTYKRVNTSESVQQGRYSKEGAAGLFPEQV
jgi:hypothetical protein